jgi:TonB family protein
MTLGAVVVGLSLLQRVVSSVSPSSATTSTDQLAFQSEIVSLKHAQAAIPKALDAIYASLDQGDPAAATRYLLPKITSSTDALDFICRPFTHRAHYVEAVVARLGFQFQAHVRVLFKPLDERAYTMEFQVTNQQAVLESARETEDEWFASQKAEASEIVRRFLYSLKAGHNEIAKTVTSANFPFAQCVEDVDIQRHLGLLQEVRINEETREQYLGLHMVVVVSFPEDRNINFLKASKRFYLEPIAGQLKIVRAFYSRDVGQYQADPSWRWGHYYEDPGIEAYTLARFGLGGHHDAEPAAGQDEVVPPTVLHRVEPEFSAEARQANFNGEVRVSLVVDEQGNATDIAVIDSPGLGLDEKIIEAVKQWKFKPGSKDGTPVASKATITVAFRRY